MAAAAADSSLPGGQAEDMAPMGEEEEERLATLLGIAEECDTEDELRLLLRGNPYPVCYDSFQPTSRMTHRPGCFESNTCEKNGTSWMQSKNLDSRLVCLHEQQAGR